MHSLLAKIKHKAHLPLNKRISPTLKQLFREMRYMNKGTSEKNSARIVKMLCLNIL